MFVRMLACVYVRERVTFASRQQKILVGRMDPEFIDGVPMANV